MNIKGQVWKFGANVDTDVIIPVRYLISFDPVELGKHCLEGIDPEFAQTGSARGHHRGGREFRLWLFARACAGRHQRRWCSVRHRLHLRPHLLSQCAEHRSAHRRVAPRRRSASRPAIRLRSTRTRAVSSIIPRGRPIRRNPFPPSSRSWWPSVAWSPMWRDACESARQTLRRMHEFSGGGVAGRWHRARSRRAGSGSSASRRRRWQRWALSCSGASQVDAPSTNRAIHCRTPPYSSAVRAMLFCLARWGPQMG